MGAGVEVESVGELSGNNVTNSDIGSNNSSVLANPISSESDCQNTSENR